VHVQADNSKQQRTAASNSRLSKTLEEVLADKGALGYFIQYLEARGVFSLIKLWLDIESFKAAAATRDCANSISGNAPAQEHGETKFCPSHYEPDKLSLSTDSGSVFESPLHSSCSANDISVRGTCIGTPDGQETIRSNLPLFQPPNISLTCSEGTVPHSRYNSSSCNLNCSDQCNIFGNNKPNNFNIGKTDSYSFDSAVTFDCYKKEVGVSESETDNDFIGCEVCGGESESEQVSFDSSKVGRTKSLSVEQSRLTQATVDDALRIFNKYISHEAAHPVRVPDDIRDRVVAAICSDAAMVDAESFTELQEFIFQTMEKE
jgi:hypothetical protein